MKSLKVLTIIFSLVVIMPTTGCEKFLDERPFSTIDPNEFWKSKTDTDAWMAAIYNQMQTTLGDNHFLWGEVRADNFEVGGVGNAQIKLVSNTLSSNDNDLNNVTRWNNLYEVISLCNYGIKYFPGMIEANIENSRAVYRNYLGQCYGLRALMYFYGLRVWGRMPLHIEPIEAVTQTLALPRASLDQMRTQILGDISEALKDIGTSTTNKFMMQRAAVFALQTDVAMWFQDYQLALTASQFFVNNNAYSWVNNVENFKNIFTTPETSTETIFNLFWSFSERGGAIRICANLGSNFNNALYNPTVDVFSLLKNRIDPITERSIDGRYWAYYDTLLYTTEEFFASQMFRQFGKYAPWQSPRTARKFFTFQSNVDCSVKMPIYRYADIMLLRAEALNKTGQHQAALNIVNAVRNRVGYTVNAQLSDYTGNLMQGIERTILEERRIELMGEGKRWFDMCRIDKINDFTDAGYQYLRETMNPILEARRSLSSLYAGVVLFEGNNMGRILFPINFIAFNSNPMLIGDQNPPYDE